MSARITIGAVVVVLLAVAPILGATEHPVTSGEENNRTNWEISAAIKNYTDVVSKNSRDKKFHLIVRILTPLPGAVSSSLRGPAYSVQNKDVVLELVRIREDRFFILGDKKYFACVDMKGIDGSAYDIDFFLTHRGGRMKVTHASVHKINGKPLYNWNEEGGVWKKVS